MFKDSTGSRPAASYSPILSLIERPQYRSTILGPDDFYLIGIQIPKPGRDAGIQGSSRRSREKGWSSVRAENRKSNLTGAGKGELCPVKSAHGRQKCAKLENLHLVGKQNKAWQLVRTKV